MRSLKFGIFAAFSLLAFAAPGNGHHHVQNRTVKTEVVLVTQTVYTTLTIASSSITSASQPTTTKLSTVSSPKAMTSTAQPSPAPPPKLPKGPNNPFAALVAEPNKAIILNSCDYDVYISSMGDQSCGPDTTANSRLLPANSTYREPIRTCYKSGVSLKVARTKHLTRPMQFEYAVWDDKKTVSYDISYLDCMVVGLSDGRSDGSGSKDFSGCVGHEKGIQAAAGQYCPVFQCLAGVECAQHAYTVPEFGYLPGAPVGAYDVEKGIAFEVCAENRV